MFFLSFINFVDMHTLPHQPQVDRKGVGILFGTRPFMLTNKKQPPEEGLCSCDHHAPVITTGEHMRTNSLCSRSYQQGNMTPTMISGGMQPQHWLCCVSSSLAWCRDQSAWPDITGACVPPVWHLCPSSAHTQQSGERDEQTSNTLMNRHTNKQTHRQQRVHRHRNIQALGGWVGSRMIYVDCVPTLQLPSYMSIVLDVRGCVIVRWFACTTSTYVLSPLLGWPWPWVSTMGVSTCLLTALMS